MGKKIGCGVLASVLAVVMLVVVILSRSDVEDLCRPADGSLPSAAVEGVPAGSFSYPEANALDHMTSGYGMRWGSMHNGLDIAQGEGTPIYAWADGVVSAAGPAGGFGQWIIIDHNVDGELLSTVYGHMFPEGVRVAVGDQVKAGQHIADEGWNGHVEPPGPGGSHLHFEVWPGGRLQGGGPVDPLPFVEQGVEPGSGEGGTEDQDLDDADPTAPTGMAELPADERFDESNLQVNAVRLGRATALNYPQLEVIGGWRPSDDTSDDHPSGRAVDAMIPNWQSQDGITLGDSIVEYILGNWEFFDVNYIIWRQQLIYPGSSETMADRGSPTQNHFDHVHVSVNSSEMATPASDIGAGPIGGAAPVAQTKNTQLVDCEVHPGTPDTAFNAHNIPESWIRPIQIAGGTCADVNASLIAGLLEQESGFQVDAVSTAGATGPGQFMPDTWAGAGAEMSEDGEIIGPPGSGDINDPKDAIPATGRYLCDIASRQQPLLASGEIAGDAEELMLAGYNAGEGAVQRYGGVPPFAETQHYVKVVPQHAQKYKEI